MPLDRHIRSANLPQPPRVTQDQYLALWALRVVLLQPLHCVVAVPECFFRELLAAAHHVEVPPPSRAPPVRSLLVRHLEEPFIRPLLVHKPRAL